MKRMIAVTAFSLLCGAGLYMAWLAWEIQTTLKCVG